MSLSWLVVPADDLNIFILNKTVPDIESQKNNSLFWILNNEKITKPNEESYSEEQDYFGFFPFVDTFKIKDINQLSPNELDSLAFELDAAYFVDTYGVYSQDLNTHSTEPRTLIYGGLSENELKLAKALKKSKKLIISEFNIISAPTPKSIQDEFLKTFSLVRRGWSGRYFDSLDSTASDAEIPAWALRLHREKTRKAWPYKRSGVILVSDFGQIIVLEGGVTLEHRVPFIQTRPLYQEKYNLPEQVNFTSWFDLVYSPSRRNTILSMFHLPVTELGDSLLAVYGLSPAFPAAFAQGDDFYYFSGSFSENKISYFSSRFLGIQLFRSFFYNSRDVLDTRAFFWEYYRPLVSSILEQAKEQ